MSITIVLLVIFLSILHVIWNLNLKRSAIKDLYMSLALVAATLLFLPLGIFTWFQIDMSFKY